MNKENKIIRGKNFTNAEKYELVKEVSAHRHIIENKETNITTNKEKETWANITKNFNMGKSVCFERTEKNLRNCWENIKRDTRKYDAMLQREIYKTGGGLPNIKTNPLLEQVREIMCQATVSGLYNPFDSDSTTTNEDVLVEDVLQDDTSSDDPAEVFSYLLKNKVINSWKSCNVKNLKSEISSPLKENVEPSIQIGSQKRKYEGSNQLDEAKIELTKILKATIETKNNYEVEILKTKLEQEKLKVELLKITIGNEKTKLEK